MHRGTKIRISDLLLKTMQLQIYVYKYLYIDIYRSFICSVTKLEKTQVRIDGEYIPNCDICMQ